jgi:hypothetical protein
MLKNIITVIGGYDEGVTPMIIRFAEASALELERTLERLFENPKIIPGTSRLAEIPVVGGQYITSLDRTVPMLRVCRALAADAKFRQETSLPLPLRQQDCDALINDDDPKVVVVGHYASSQRGEYWHPEHPSFTAFARGLMAYRHTPIKIRNNRELLWQFPPVRLKGMCDGRLDWRSPETLAEDRLNDRRVAEHEAYEAAQIGS